MVAALHSGSNGVTRLIVRDATGGFVFEDIHGPAPIVGDLITAKGYTFSSADLQQPSIHSTGFVRHGQHTPPAPRMVTLDDISGGREDFNLVRMQGFVSEVEADEINPAWNYLILRKADKMAYVSIPLDDLTHEDLCRIVDSEVELTGIVLPHYAGERMFVGPHLELWGRNCIRVLRPSPADPFEAPYFEDVVHASPTELAKMRRRRIEGRVLATWGGNRCLVGASTGRRWFKGMLHCHCYWSDGRAFPEQGAKAYYDHGYNFYCMSDHNRLGKNPAYWRDVCETEGSWPMNVYRPIFESYCAAFPDAEIRQQGGKTQVRIKTFDEIKAKFDRPGQFLVLPGMEITRMAGERHVHMNYVNLNRGLATAEAGGLIQSYGSTVSEVIGKSKTEVDALAAELGNPAHLFFVNHPHWRFWDVLPQDVLDHPGVRFFEICNCGSDIPLPSNMSEKNFSCDRFWDIVLANRCRANGSLLYGIASDDAHWYPNSGTPQQLFPFADGYVQVRAEELTAEALVAAMDRGDFYASCGVDLEDVVAEPGRGRLTVSVPANDGVAYTIRFVGTKCDFDAGVADSVHFSGNVAQSLGARDYPIYSDTIGITFKSVVGRPGERVEASYTLKDDELYVRAIVESSEAVNAYAQQSHQHPRHPMAWTQPIRKV